jgi:hypothetical protein
MVWPAPVELKLWRVTLAWGTAAPVAVLVTVTVYDVCWVARGVGGHLDAEGARNRAEGRPEEVREHQRYAEPGAGDDHPAGGDDARRAADEAERREARGDEGVPAVGGIVQPQLESAVNQAIESSAGSSTSGAGCWSPRTSSPDVRSSR